MLSIQLLGPPLLERDGALLRIARRKSRALVYYLAGHERPLPREQLLSVFWPDLERPSAQQVLRTTLHGLRKALGAALTADDEAAGLAPDVQVDARRFAALLGRSRHAAREQAGPVTPDEAAGLTAALSLYHGDFLEGFSLPDGGFDDWAAIERERFRRLAVRGWATLAAAHEARGDYPAALEALERALAFDALQEDLQRAALRLHYLAGDRAGAIRRYAQLRQLLDEEMGVVPMAETRALYDAIVGDAPMPAAPAGVPRMPAEPRPQPAEAASSGPGEVPFAGREAELQALRGLLQVDAAARHRLALLEGEPGIGKTRLAEEFFAGSGALLLRGAAHEQETTLPYHPLIEALRSLAGQAAWPALRTGLPASLAGVWQAEVARLLPELYPDLAPAAAAPDESRLWEGVCQFALALARQHRLGLFLDDLQWADASTVGLLGYLVRRAQAEDAPIVFVAAARPMPRASPAAGLIRALTREDRLLRLSLQRLGPGEVEHLLRRWLERRGQAGEADPAPLAEWLDRTSEGNPFVVVEVLRYLCDHRLLQPDGRLDPSVADSPTPVVPQTVYALTESRLARLSEPARRVLDAAVAAGREFEFEVVYRAAGLSEGAALDALDELVAAGLFHPVQPGAADGPPLSPLYAFDHSLTMEVAYREVGEPRHRMMHRRLAEALLQVYGPQRLDTVAGQVAYNFAEGNTPERAAPYAYRAGQHALSLAAWAEAAAMFELAAQAETEPGPRLRSLIALGNARSRAGLNAQSSEAFKLALEQAQSLGDEAATGEAQLALAQSYLAQARFSEAIGLAQQLLGRVKAPQSRAAVEMVWATALSLEGADLAGAAEHLAKVEGLLQTAVSSGHADPLRLAHVKFEQGSVAAQQGDLPGAVALYRQALDLARQSADPEAPMRQVLANNNLAYHLQLLSPGEPAARAYAEAGLSLAQAHGLLGLLPYLHSTLGEIELDAGRLDEAEARFTEGLALAERLPNPERVAGLTANLGRAAEARGDRALAIYRFSTALAQADALGTLHLAAQIRLWLAPLLPPAEGRARLAEARALAESGGRRRLLDEAERLDIKGI